jgi:hypothetical protein
MLSSINLYGGKITFDAFKINIHQPLHSQSFYLDQDLLQIDYGDLFTLDVGWYPEMDPTGFLRILVIKDCDWNNPLYKKKLTALDIHTFPLVLEEAAKFASELEVKEGMIKKR